MSNLVEQKQKFLLLLIQTRKMLNQKKRIEGWDYVINHFKKMNPERLEEKFRINTLYLLEKIIEPELESFRLDKLNKSSNRDMNFVLKHIDEMLTDQMSAILSKIYVASLLLSNKLYIDVNELHDFISERNYNSCILHDLIREY
jgi:hypothetical protein